MNFFISFIMLQQGIFSKLLEMIKCENFQFKEIESRSYLKNYLGIECFTNNHNFWLLFIIVPLILFYGAFVPFSTLLYSLYKKKELEAKENIIKYDFLMRQPFEYRNSSFW